MCDSNWVSWLRLHTQDCQSTILFMKKVILVCLMMFVYFALFKFHIIVCVRVCVWCVCECVCADVPLIVTQSRRWQSDFYQLIHSLCRSIGSGYTGITHVWLIRLAAPVT